MERFVIYTERGQDRGGAASEWAGHVVDSAWPGQDRACRGEGASGWAWQDRACRGTGEGASGGGGPGKGGWHLDV